MKSAQSLAPAFVSRIFNTCASLYIVRLFSDAGAWASRAVGQAPMPVSKRYQTRAGNPAKSDVPPSSRSREASIFAKATM